MGDIGVAVDPAVPIIDTTSQSINILVTGFGPFRSFGVNASHLIAQSLPSTIPLPPKEGEGGSVGETAIPASREVRIHVRPEPVKVSYATIRRELPVILDDFARKNNGKRPDLVLHIGIATTRKYYSVETLAHRDDYRMPDVEGRSGYEDGESRWRENGLPAVLYPGLAEGRSERKNNDDTETQNPDLKVSPYPANEHFLQTWKSHVPAEIDLRISNDAGRYLCEFIFYSSLALALQENQDRSVIFLHVPVATDSESIETGTDVAVGLIKSMVECWVEGK